MSSIKLLLFLVLLGIAAPAHAAPKARVARASSKTLKSKAKTRAVRQSPVRKVKVRLAAKLVTKRGAGAAVANPRLLRSIQKSQKVTNENYFGVHRDIRFREPHQVAIMKSVKSMLNNASKRVRAGESTELSAALDALRAHRNKNASHLGGEGDPVQIQVAFNKMQPLLDSVYNAAKLSALPLFSPIDN